MRLLTAEEKKQRGCMYCKKVVRKRSTGWRGVRFVCPYAKCPYEVLDKYDAYEKYMKSEDSKIEGLC